MLLRNSYREDGKVKKQTLANLSHLPAAAVELVERSLKGEHFLAASDALEITRSLPHGGVVAVLGTLRSLGLERLLDRRPSRQRDLVAAMLCARLLAPGSKLATTRRWTQSTLADTLGVADATEDELYGAMDWLLARQERIEAGLAQRHLDRAGSCSTTSPAPSSRVGTVPSLGAATAARSTGTRQVEFGLVTDVAGRPVAVEVVPGDTADPATVPAVSRSSRTASS